MSSYNKVILLGNLTRDVEVRQAGGSSVAAFGLALNRKYTTAAGESREEVVFVDCEAWGKTGEVMAKYLSKGKPVLVDGRLKLDQWEDKEGKKQSKIKVSVESFQFVGGKDDGDSKGGRKPSSDPDFPF